MRYFVSDFETTVYDGQDHTEVWASATVELNTEDVTVKNSIAKWFNHLLSYHEDMTVYFHNIKFDGSFIIPFLFSIAYKLAVYKDDTGFHMLKKKQMEKRSFSTLISDRNVWYSCTICTPTGNFITIIDSYKLLPFSLEKIGHDFETKHQKLDIEYKGLRKANGYISSKERSYIENDVLVIKEALELFIEQGYTKTTIGSNCLAEFKKTWDKLSYEEFFPNLKNEELPEESGSANIDEYVRKSYEGGWCYCDERVQGKVLGSGVTADINSHYPTQCLSSEKGRPRLPIGSGRYIPHEYVYRELLEFFANPEYHKYDYYFIRFRCNFTLKKDHVPWVHIRGSWLYNPEENLKTSLVWDESKQEYVDELIGFDGEVIKTQVEKTMTHVDFLRLFDFYDVTDFELLDAVHFLSDSVMFSEYVNKWREVKENAPNGCIRTTAKLFSNNLYGKLASSDISSFKIPYMEDGLLKFHTQVEFNRQVVHIACGSAITSHARDFTIRAAQKNYDRFCYADTDSLHMLGTADQIVGLEFDHSEYGKWDIESHWDSAIFVRQKTYIEHDVENGYIMRGAGVPDRAKELFIASMEYDEYDSVQLMDYCQRYSDHIEYVTKKRHISDYKIGCVIPGKLKNKRIRGGTILVEEYYHMKP